MIRLINDFDSVILDFIRNNMHSRLVDKFMISITSLGNGGLIWIVVALLLLLTKKYRYIGVTALIALLISLILGEVILKHMFQRARPCADIPAMSLLISKPTSYSFPSGHTASSFAAAGVLSKYFKKYSLGIFVFAFLIAFSRMYLYVHYPTDVIGGIILGLASSKISQYLFNKIRTI